MALKYLPDPLIEQVRNVFSYDAATGDFTWKEGARRNRLLVGSVAGSVTQMGYLMLSHCFNGVQKRIFAHRLAWAFTHGVWPTGVIDHIDGDKRNNSISNLREVTNLVNIQNRKRASKSNLSSGLLGVSRVSSRSWRAYIYVNTKRLHLGCFDNPEKAHDAYVVAKRRLHEGNTL